MRLGLAALVLTACTPAATIAPDVHAYVDAGGDVVPSLDAAVLDSQTANDAAPEAAAPGLSYTSTTSTCSTPYAYGGSTSYYAEQAYPGATADELAGVTAWADISHADAGPWASFALPGYTRAQYVTQVKDGSVAVRCLEAGDVVTFVRVQ